LAFRARRAPFVFERRPAPFPFFRKVIGSGLQFLRALGLPVAEVFVWFFSPFLFLTLWVILFGNNVAKFLPSILSGGTPAYSSLAFRDTTFFFSGNLFSGPLSHPFCCFPLLLRDCPGPSSFNSFLCCRSFLHFFRFPKTVEGFSLSDGLSNEYIDFFFFFFFFFFLVREGGGLFWGGRGCLWAWPLVFLKWLTFIVYRGVVCSLVIPPDRQRSFLCFFGESMRCRLTVLSLSWRFPTSLFGKQTWVITRFSRDTIAAADFGSPLDCIKYVCVCAL